MALVQTEIDLCNLAADRLGAAVFTLANQSTDIVGSFFVRQYEKIRDSLLRAGEWNFARSRQALSIIKTLDLGGSAGPSAFAVGDTITGITSGTTAEIIESTSDSEYVVAYTSGDFTDGETITNATVEDVYNNGVRVLNDTAQVVNYDTSDSDTINCGTGYPVVSDDVPSFEWGLQYLLPDDFMRFIAVYEDDGTDDPSDRFHLEGNRLLTNYSTVNLRYVKKVTDPTLFDALFVDVLVLRLALAALPAVAGTKTSDLRAELKEELKYAESKAKCVGLQEQNTSGYFGVSLARYNS